VTQAQAAGLDCTFKVNQDDKQFQVPYLTYCQFLNYGYMTSIEPCVLNLTKSFVTVENPLPNNGFSAYMLFGYDNLTDAEWKKLQASIVENKLKYGNWRGKLD
jgi:hypothetical protein